MIQAISWYIAILVIGLGTFPISYRFFSKLPDRGYSFSKILGLLLWGIIFWFFCTFQILTNDLFSSLLAFLVVILISALCLRKGGWKEITGWVRQNLKAVLTAELVFLTAFVLWAVVRAANPDIANTEKPMELAFINAILKSPKFPPQDPWLSGYSISYYYLGYVLVALMIRVTGVTSAYGYNLAGALWFALTAVAAFGILSNVIVAFIKKPRENSKRPAFSLGGLLGPFFVLIVSNLEGFLEVLNSLGLFWKPAADGTLQSRFWTWLGILDLNTAPTTAPSIIPTRWMWWWRASRVVGQSDLAGNAKEIIDEFPFFSYLLADLHPHVLTMPFAMLAILIGLNFYLTWRERKISEFKIWDWVRTPGFWLTAVVFGSLGFLNTWDLPIYIAFFMAVFALVRYQQMGNFWKRLWDFLRMLIFLILVGIVIFLPFYVAFQSQAGGILPSLDFFTRNVHFWIMFAPLMIPIIIWVIYESVQKDEKPGWKSGFAFALAILLILLVGSWSIGWLFSSLPALSTAMQNSSSQLLQNLAINIGNLGTNFSLIHGMVAPKTLLIGSLVQRIKAPGTVLTLFLIIFAIWSLLGKRKKEVGQELAVNSEQQPFSNGKRDHGFLFLLVLLGAGLTLIPEFFYLKDQFGWPINTYFKFYFEAWIFWGLAAAVATYILFTRLRKGWLIGFSIAWIILISMALVYPVFSVYTKTNNFKPASFTLDGLQYREVSDPGEEEAINWLRKAPNGVVAEAVGGEYSSYARVATETGLSDVLGWPGHEIQWRGGTSELGSRESDIQTIYQNNDWTTVESILKKYNIRYVFVGSLENQKYAPDDLSRQSMMNKFTSHLPVVFANGTVTIFEYQPEVSSFANQTGSGQ